MWLFQVRGYGFVVVVRSRAAAIAATSFEICLAAETTFKQKVIQPASVDIADNLRLQKPYIES